MTARAALVLLALALALTACGRIRELRACRALGQLMNPVLDDISRRTEKERTQDTYRYAARRYAALSRDVAKFDLDMPRAEKSVDELASAFKQAGVQSKKLADALEKKDHVLASNARRELVQLARLQNGIVTRIERDCVVD